MPSTRTAAAASPQAAWSPAVATARTSALSVALLAGAAAAGLLAPGPLGEAGPELLVVAGLVGLPHGAVDHLALGWSRGRSGPADLRVLVGYALAAAAAAAVAVAFPLPAVLLLLGLSAAHFAEGEAAWDRLRGGQGLALPAAALGTAVVALPLLVRPADVRPLLAGLDPGLPSALAAVRAPVLLLTAVLVAAGLAQALAARQRAAAAELALVVAATLVAPPLLVFAGWFAGWHTPRHLVRLAALQPDGDGPTRARRLVRGAALPTLVALSGLVALALLLGGLPGAVLVALLALTVPHATVVARLQDARQSSGTTRPTPSAATATARSNHRAGSVTAPVRWPNNS